MNLRKKLLIVSIVVLAICGLTGCGSEQNGKSSNDSNSTPSSTNEQQANLKDQSLHIYCDVSMQKNFQEIVDTFKEKTGADVQVIFEDAKQIQEQLNASEDGNFFIAGSKADVKPIEEFVTDGKVIVRHIPVLAVQAGNPKGIHNLQDLTKDGITVITGDPKSTLIGKIAQQAFTDEEIIDKVNIISNNTTALQMTTALIKKEAVAAITWKEDCNVDDVEVVKTPDMEPYIKSIPIVRLKFDTDNKVAPIFYEFLDSDEVHNIWIKYGYEIED